MKIAILAWGSLIWDPRNLMIDKTQGNNGWFNKGPMLPIEFARISQDGRLTLVIVSGKDEIQTMYSISEYEDLNLAILDLSIREGCSTNTIGNYTKQNSIISPSEFQFIQNIQIWIDRISEIDAVIWTDLPKKLWYNDENNKKVLVQEDRIIEYLRGLSPEDQAKAEEYIRKAPSIVQTPIRDAIEVALGWTQIPTPT